MRDIEFDSLDNVRDLGGLPLLGGGSTRFGIAFRAGTPQQITAHDLATLLDKLGVRTLLDLRNPDEVEREGYGLLADAPLARVNLPIRRDPHAVRLAAGDLVPDSTRYDLVGLYRDLLAGSPASFVAAARLIADTGSPVMFHCAAGKDRTGVLAAVLLDAVGVPADAIAEDYALTGAAMERVRARLDTLPSYQGLPPADTGVLAVTADIMDKFLTHLHHDHGGAAAWLQANGLPADTLRRLRVALTGRA